ncbi:Antibiotic efflux pump periplasmic linker protein ArpA precursor [Planctomycetes bacterium MalM25]|nr:Antibiotic efflux pump periplasmic linker protein ArpA precursor [Planctomycetes bacterium MalM25]
MTKHLARLGRFVLLIAITVLAGGVMWWVSRKSNEADPFAAGGEVVSTPLASQPRTLVKAVSVEPSMRDIVLRYSGKIEPWETYSLGFEIGGRVATLGKNADGSPLDDGDRVEAGQELARLDDRVLRARLAEAVANFELASSDLERSRRVRQVSPSAITESEYQNDVTQRAQTAAAQQVAEKNLEDSLIASPITGSIAERMIEAGESVTPHATVFEIVENDRLRLIVNVPEARVRELELRRRSVTEALQTGVSDPEERVFRTHVLLEGNDLYGKPWPTIEAEVYRIAEIADRVTGLFEVEIVIDNRDGLLRPGMVATADIVTDRILAYELPEAAVLFRADATYLYTVTGQPAAMPVLFWEAGETEVQYAKKVALTRWVDQGETILIPSDGAELSRVVTRGQQRLHDGQLIRTIADREEDEGVAERRADGASLR